MSQFRENLRQTEGRTEGQREGRTDPILLNTSRRGRGSKKSRKNYLKLIQSQSTPYFERSTTSFQMIATFE